MEIIIVCIGLALGYGVIIFKQDRTIDELERENEELKAELDQLEHEQRRLTGVDWRP